MNVGDFVKVEVKGVTNDRRYKGVGKIVSLHGPIAVVRYSQPWSRFMRETPYKVAELKPFKPRNPYRYGLAP